MPTVQKAAVRGKHVRAATDTDRSSALAGFALLPVLLGTVAVAAAVAVVANNQSNG